MTTRKRAVLAAEETRIARGQPITLFAMERARARKADTLNSRLGWFPARKLHV